VSEVIWFIGGVVAVIGGVGYYGGRPETKKKK